MKDGLHLDLAIEAVFGCAQRLLGIAREQGADVLQIIFDRRNLAGPYQARHRLILACRDEPARITLNRGKRESNAALPSRVREEGWPSRSSPAPRGRDGRGQSGRASCRERGGQDV